MYNAWENILLSVLFVADCVIICHFVKMSSAVSDADGDVVRCRWANSSLGECGDVCQTFPATLDQVTKVRGRKWDESVRVGNKVSGWRFNGVDSKMI